MLLANTSLKEKHIVRVYDSDERKRGKEMAGCEIQPFDEKDIDNGVIEGILVTTYTAQQPIEKVLENYMDRCRVYTLYEM